MLFYTSHQWEILNDNVIQCIRSLPARLLITSWKQGLSHLEERLEGLQTSFLCMGISSIHVAVMPRTTLKKSSALLKHTRRRES